MVGKVVTPETAPVTHSVFAEQEQEEDPADDLSNPDDAVVKKSQDILTTAKYVYIKEVVREPRIWFKRVPRLGSFLSVPLVYNSCLTDEALEAAI